MGSTEDGTVSATNQAREMVWNSVELIGRALSPDESLTAANAIKAACLLRQSADAILGELVAYAREEGATWNQVAAALGVTTQAAHQRFARPKPS